MAFAGVISKLGSLVAGVDITGVRDVGEEVEYDLIVTTLVDKIAKIKAIIWSVLQLPPSIGRVVEVTPLERGPIYKTYKVRIVVPKVVRWWRRGG